MLPVISHPDHTELAVAVQVADGVIVDPLTTVGGIAKQLLVMSVAVVREKQSVLKRDVVVAVTSHPEIMVIEVLGQYVRVEFCAVATLHETATLEAVIVAQPVLKEDVRPSLTVQPVIVLLKVLKQEV